ncbi:hypothetical protein N9V13_04905 [Betaproteobacteria bacterium]|nr:hypothetical protein [Betaproteobacteria bacterium]
MHMRSFFLFTIFSLSFTTYANEWKEFGKDANGHIHYVDIGNIEKADGIIYYWSLVDFMETTTLGTRSNVSKYKVDCADQKQTWLSYAYFSESMGKGKKITSSVPVWNHYGSTLNEIRSLTPNSIEYRLMMFVCGKKM